MSSFLSNKKRCSADIKVMHFSPPIQALRSFCAYSEKEGILKVNDDDIFQLARGKKADSGNSNAVAKLLVHYARINYEG